VELSEVRDSLTEAGLNASSAKVLRVPAVLFSSRASIGKIAVATRACTTNQGFINFMPDISRLDPWFLAYYLRFRTPDIIQLAGETTYKEVSRGKMRDFPLWLPPLSEQRRIVARIQECLARVEELSHLSSTLRLEAEAIEAAVFRDAVEGLPEEQRRLASLGGLIVGSQYGTSTKANSDGRGCPVLRMGNIQNGHLSFHDLRYVPLSPEEAKKYLLREGDVLINRTNSLELVGKAAVYESAPDGDHVFASYLIRLRLDTGRAVPQYVSAAINSAYGRDYILRTARRAIGMVNINAKEIAAMPLPFPSPDQQRRVVASLKAARDTASGILESVDVEQVEALRDSVLRHAFAGEL
jgi:type I restriction enzyme S subunit